MGFNIKRIANLPPNTEDGLARSLSLSKKASIALLPILRDASVGIDFSDVANVRVTPQALILYVKTSWQKVKLRQLMPRLDVTAQAAGFTVPVEVVVRPEGKARNTPQIALFPRKPSLQAARSLKEKASSITEPALKDAIERLARTLQGT